MHFNRSGATIIDLVVAVTLASGMMAVVFPRAGGFIDRIEVRGAVAEIEALFSLARHAAISRGAQAVLEIDPGSGVISIRAGAEQIRRREVGEAHGVRLSTNRTSMTYSPIGVGYGAANFSLVVSRNSVADTVIISRLGRVRH